MSKVAITGNASGTGTFTIASPNSNSDRTLNLPDNSGTVLTSASNLAGVTGVGKVLQVVQGTLATVVSSSSSTYADTGLTATITPTSATSNILVIVNHTGCGKATGDTSLGLRLLRGSTEIDVFEVSAGATSSAATNVIGGVSTAYLDSPSTISPVSYKTQLASNANVATVFVQNNSCNGTITLMEIAA